MSGTPPARDATGMKRLALGLLLGATAVYAVAVALRSQHPAWGYVAAAAEAAMIGALADWFAVVALFRHPLGLPVPHTAVIPRNKDRIGRSLGQFITTHFLATAQVQARVQAFDVATRLAHWLAQPINARRVAVRVSGLAQWAAGALAQRPVRRTVIALMRRGLGQLDVSTLSAQVLAGLTHERRHQALLDGVLQQVAELLAQPRVQEGITEAIAREIKALKYVGLDQMAARLATRKLLAVVAHTMADMADDPQHALRQRFDEAVQDLIARLQTDPALRQRTENLKRDLLANPALARQLNQMWSAWLAWLRQALAQPESALNTYLADATCSLGQMLAHDAELRAWLNAELQAAIPPLLARYRGSVGQYIASQVQQWDAQALSAELERHIGRDLQFIRINGTVVGALAGLLIYSLTQWLGR